jgi:hypothetical protein
MFTRDYMQIGVFIFVAGLLTFLVVTDGDKESKALLFGIFATKIVDFAFKVKGQNDKP